MRHTVNPHRDAFAGINFRRLDIDRQNLQRQNVHFLFNRHHERAAAFDNAKADAAFFPDGRFKSNFLVNIGYGTGEGIAPRNPRLSFEETCKIL